MADRWFRLPEVKITDQALNTEDIKPKYYDRVRGFSMVNPHPDGNSPKIIVRMYADEATLDEIANKNDVVELPDAPVTALNNRFGVDRSKQKWEESMRVSN